MYFKDYEAFRVEDTKTVKMVCSNCGNESEHEACAEPVGITFGLPFAKKPWLSSHKRYYLICPICKNATKQIKKDEVLALKK